MNVGDDARRQALNDVDRTMRVLTANLIGIVRGSGKPLELRLQVESFAAALESFESATREHPKAWELAEMLRVNLDPEDSVPKSEEDMAELYAEHVIVQASLQLASARLLKQESEAADAYADLHRALSGLEETKRKITKRRQDAEEYTGAQTKISPASGRPD